MSSTPLGHLRWAPSEHLGATLEAIERHAADVGSAVARGRTAPGLWNLAVIATCRLDGSAMTAVPDAGDVASLVTATSTVQDIQRREYVGVANALGADDLGATLARDPLKGLPALHRLITAGLVAPSSAGQLRRSPQVVHDGAEGRIVYNPVPPEAIAPDLPLVREIVGARSLHAVVRAGLVQFEVLRLHPFESANGRLARVAARLLLRVAGLDPGGLAVADLPMSARRVGNYDMVAAALRSGDLTMWLETWAEDVATGLQLAAGHLEIPTDVGDVAQRAVQGLDPRFTLPELRDAAGHELARDLDGARRLAWQLAGAGAISVESGSRGLRWRRRPVPLPGWARRLEERPPPHSNGTRDEASRQ